MGDALATVPLVREAPATRDRFWQAAEVAERAASAALLAVSAPVLLSSAAAVALLSGRTPFIAHRRVGWGGSTLWMIKLRTMWDASRPAARSGWIEYVEDEAGPAGKAVRDTRVPHAFARFCRRHSIDEIPQLWHVMRGEMALVGPRPLTAVEIRKYYQDDAEELLQVKPGIAGLWQTHGRSRLTYAERRQMDLEWVRNRSVKSYLGILAGAVREVLSGANAW